MPDSSLKYLYVDRKDSNQFLVLYKEKDREYFPIQCYKIGQVTREPVQIKIEEALNEKFFLLITEDLTDISDWDIFRMKGGGMTNYPRTIGINRAIK